MDGIVESKNESAGQVLAGPWMRRDFWQRFKWHMESTSSVNCARVTTDGWMWHNTDLPTGNMLSLIRVRLGEIGVKFTLNDANAATVFSHLSDHRRRVDAYFGEALDWRSGGDDSFVIEVRAKVDSFDPSVWPDHYAWLQRRLETFRVALGALLGRTPPKGETSLWDERQFMRELYSWNLSAVAPATAVLDWTERSRLTATWGRGRSCGSFAVSVASGGVTYQPVVVRTDGTFLLPFAQLSKTPLFQPAERRLAFLERLNRLKYFSLPESAAGCRTLLPLAMLAEPRACEEFLEVLAWFGDVVKSGRKD